MKSGDEIYIIISYANFKYLQPHPLELFVIWRDTKSGYVGIIATLSQVRKLFLSRVVATHFGVIILNAGLTP